MNAELENYSKFFNDQISELVSQYRKSICVPMKQLLESDFAFAVTVRAVSRDRGHVIFECDKKHAPRLKVLKSFLLIKKAARDRWGSDLRAWDCSFEEFLGDAAYHSSSSSVLPLYFLKSEHPDRVLVGCGGVSTIMFQKLSSALCDGMIPRAIIFDTEPPTRYLANLARYIERNENDLLLLAKPTISYDQWKPELLAYDKNDQNGISRTILRSLSVNRKVVLQGPPGAGKSFCAAQVIADYLSRGKTVCVIAMANKALMEMITQPPLAQYLKDKKLAKTMMTSDEGVVAKGLKDVDSDYVVPKGEALFATYYKFSNQFRSVEDGKVNCLYDLVVIEEASQAYLATIAATLKLCNACLVVGDPMQLSPIVQAENKVEYKRWCAVVQAEGLSTFVLGTKVKSFRITTTFRLTSEAAKLSGVFYGNTLVSVAPAPKGWEKLNGAKYFPESGGAVYEILPGGTDGILSKSAEATIRNVLTSILQQRPKSSVAVITPFRDSAKAIQRKFSLDDTRLDLSVETIDRVQGATVDYTILYFPLRNSGFALNERRFNVATSRSRTTTLVLSDYDLLSMVSVTGRVRAYLERVTGVIRDLPAPADSQEVPGDVELLAVASEQAVVSPLQLQESLDKCQVALMRWLKGWLPTIHPENAWRDGVAKKLTEMQYRSVKARGILSVDGLDLSSLITVFLGNFHELQSRSHVTQELQTMAFHIRDIRNLNAHRSAAEIETVDSKDLKYHIDTVDRFLAGIARCPPADDARPSVSIKRGGITIVAR